MRTRPTAGSTASHPRAGRSRPRRPTYRRACLRSPRSPRTARSAGARSPTRRQGRPPLVGRWAVARASGEGRASGSTAAGSTWRLLTTGSTLRHDRRDHRGALRRPGHPGESSAQGHGQHHRLAGDIYACEDHDDTDGLGIGILSPQGEVARFLRATGSAHSGSDLCGVVFDPSGTRLYFRSQTALGGGGAIYEVTGTVPHTGSRRPTSDRSTSRRFTSGQLPTPAASRHCQPCVPPVAPRRFEPSRFINRGLRASVEI